jgi:hypothetical protein
MNYELFSTFGLSKLIKTMEQQDKMRLMKPRSYRMILVKGFQLYLGNFRRLLKASWLTALIYALFCGALGTVTAIQLPKLTTAIMQQAASELPLTPELSQFYLMTAGAILLLALLSTAALAVASGTLLNKLKEHKETDAISVPEKWLKPSMALTLRTVKGVFMTLGITLLPCLLLALLVGGLERMMPETAANHSITFKVTTLALLAVILLFALPLMHVLMKYVLEPPCRYWSVVRPAYKRGLRHMGLIVPVFFISLLLTSIVGLVVTMPSQILYLANQEAHLGLLIGDELGMPSYITPLTFFTVTACSLLGFYVGQLTLLHCYYLYGSIESRVAEESNTDNQVTT